MNIKNLKVRMASIGLSLALAGGSSIAMSMPVFAEDEADVNEIEVTLEEEQKEELVVEEKQVEKKQEETVQEEKKEEVVEEKQEEEKKEEVKQEEEKQEEPVAEKKEETKEARSISNPEPVSEVVTTTGNEAKAEGSISNPTPVSEVVTTTSEEETTNDNTTASTETSNETHKVSVITTKVDADGNPLTGAVMQILDKDGNVVDEWVSDGTEHFSMLPEGEYTLHEVSAPDGYTTAADKTFTVLVEVNDITADVEHDQSHDVCWHYGGVPLYYIESQGEREEVYCINQDWDEPDGVDYNGVVLDENNIRMFAPDADASMSDTALYNKVLDIIYHRSKAEELFPNLSEVEIRFITEYALKTYTSAEVTTKQAMRDENGHLIRDDDGNLVYEDIRFLRYYRYDPDSPKGYVVDPENGNGVGKLAEHWYNQHNHTKIPAEYVELFNYLVSEMDKHPEDMHLYIYSTKNMTADGETYQNLLGVRWFDPYDENYKVYLSLMNELAPTPPDTPEIPPEKPDEPTIPEKPTKPEKPVVVAKVTKKTTSPQTGDDSHGFEWALAGLGSALGLVVLSAKRKEDQKVKVK